MSTPNGAPSSALTKPEPARSLVRSNLTRDQIDLLKRTIAKGTTDDECDLFLATANRMGLDPFAKQIYAIKRWDRRENRDVMSIQVGIDGYRTSSMRTGFVDGQEGPFWCDYDGKWTDVWLHDGPPAAAKVVVYRKGCSHPFVGVAAYQSYVQLGKEGKPNAMWSRGADFMLAKCAEALALRKAFPAELGGTVTAEEVSDEPEPREFSPLPTSTQIAAPLETDRGRFLGSGEAEPEPEAAPTEGAAPQASTLTDDDVLDLIADMCKTTDVREVNRIAAGIAKLNPSDAQRAQLVAAFKENASRCKKASAA